MGYHQWPFDAKGVWEMNLAQNWTPNFYVKYIVICFYWFLVWFSYNKRNINCVSKKQWLYLPSWKTYFVLLFMLGNISSLWGKVNMINVTLGWIFCSLSIRQYFIPFGLMCCPQPKSIFESYSDILWLADHLVHVLKCFLVPN